MDYNASAVAARMRGKTKRLFLRAPVVSQLSEMRYLAQLGRHAENLPWLNRDRFNLVAELRQHGIAVRDAATMIPPDALDIADRFVDDLRNSTATNSSLDVPEKDLRAHPALYKWGLDDDNLDLAEYYIGLPVQYLGVGVKRERADGIAVDARQWHLDIEDRRMLKIIVYLDEVHDGCGPFEYVDREWSAQASRTLRYTSGYLPDSAIARVVPEREWDRITGPRLSAIFVDTTRVFHRAKPPTDADRYSMTFTYSSTTPYQTFPEFLPSGETLSALRSGLSPRQRRAAMVG